LLPGKGSATSMDSERGVYVIAVAKGSKADRNGLKANDVILKVDSQETNTTKDVVAKFDAARWKGTIEILLFSQQNQKVVKMKNE
jgi:S1-C subfamily serine protease